MRRSEIGHNCIDDMFYLRDSLIWKIEHEKLKLQQRIDKAIKYIENNINDLKEDHLFIEFTKEELYILLDILKGSDSNE